MMYRIEFSQNPGVDCDLEIGTMATMNLMINNNIITRVMEFSMELQFPLNEAENNFFDLDDPNFSVTIDIVFENRIIEQIYITVNIKNNFVLYNVIIARLQIEIIVVSFILISISIAI